MSQQIQIDGLVCRRGAFQLGPLSLTVPRGGRCAVVGPSGSGKTTLLRCLAGFERSSAGTLHLGDRLVAGPGTHLPPDQRRLGLVFQDGSLWPHLTALQHLRFAAPGLSQQAARQLLDRAGIGALAERKPPSFSGGEAQRLGLVRALAAAPDLLLLDEPLRSVDVHQRDGLVLLLRELADQTELTTLLVTHDRDEALALATQIAVMHQGALVEQGPALELLRTPRTAFTAAFLAGAACLPTTAAGATLDTPFGRWPRPAEAQGDADLRLVLLPGEATAAPRAAGSASSSHSAHGAPGPHQALATVVSCVPVAHGFAVRCALAGHLLTATAASPLSAGAEVVLTAPPTAPILAWDQPLRPASRLSP